MNLMLYKDYVEMYRRSLECLEKSKQEPNFRKFLEVRFIILKEEKNGLRIIFLLGCQNYSVCSV